MDKREEFKNLLYGIHINNTCKKEYAHNELVKIQQWLIKNIPKKLYRYRSYNDLTINALKKNEIWGSIYSEFNDCYECTPCFNIQNFRKIIANKLSFDSINKQINNIKEGNLAKKFTNSYENAQINRLITTLVNMQNNNYLREFCASIQLQIAEFTLENLEEILHQFYNSFAITEAKRYLACFSELNNSSLMWGHYADGHKGFCIEYDFNSIIKPCNKDCTLLGCNNFMLNPSIAPVIYSKTRFDATSHLITIVISKIFDLIKHETSVSFKDFYSDCQIVSKTFLTKSIDWAYEKEWRLFSNVNETITNKHNVICELKPTAIYLGIKMSEENKKELFKFCKKEHIPCYIMFEKYSDNSFNLQSIEYNIYNQSCNKQNNMPN